MIIAAIGCGVIVNVDAWRIRLFNYIFEEQEGSINISMEKEEQENTQVSSDTSAPEYIPKGYLLDNAQESDGEKKMIFKNKEGEAIIFQVNEHASTNTVAYTDQKETIKINGMEGFVIRTETKNMLVWQANEVVYTLSGTISIEEMTRMAEST